MVISVIEILSFIAAFVALFVACRAYRLQKKSDKDLNRIEGNMNRMEASIQQIDKILFEVEKNHLASLLPEEERECINTIFYEKKYDFIETPPDKDGSQWSGGFTVKFIKESNGLPKMNYPFSRTGDFPYFCVYVVERDRDYKGKIQLKTYYYLSYSYADKAWYMAEKYPIHKGFRVIFAEITFGGQGLPLASEFCKNC